ncbi:MAG: autophagy- protein 2 [Thelocarpon impressellum]|nr:MAG: autophagy- protein 2 [Thelocarpon impressellum]
MASYLLPAYIQKRLLRYALSQLEVLDTDALDLEKLDIAWGKRSTVELRDVGLRLKVGLLVQTLSSLLQLPLWLELNRATVLLLRVTVPADVYSSPISLEIEGVDVQIRGALDQDARAKSAGSSPASPRVRRRKRGKGRRSHQHQAMPGAFEEGEEDETWGTPPEEATDDEDGGLPTTVDLAASFLQAESQQDRVRLEAEIASASQRLSASSVFLEEDAVPDEALGTGTGLSLPVFLANFLKGVADRLQVQVKGVEVKLDIDLRADSASTNTTAPRADPVTVLLRIEDVRIDGAAQLSSLGQGHPRPSPSADEAEVESPETAASVRVEAGRITLELMERSSSPDLSLASSSRASLAESSPERSPDADVLLQATLIGLALERSTTTATSTTTLSVAKAMLGYARDSIISFDAGLKMRASTRDSLGPVDRDVLITIVQTESSRKINVATLPIHISLNLQRLDEAFSWFGGISSVLGLGSSIASNSTITGPSPVASRSPDRRRGVHFAPAATTHPQDTATSESKTDVRLGGVVIDLIGKECSVRLDTTALKLVSREEGVGAQVDRIQLSGPCLRGNGAAAVTMEFGNNRIEYLARPKETDLARLLSLLTPSSNKYDQDDDILLDTLLRQRRQGSVLRLTVTTVKIHVTSHDALPHLSLLGDELAKLSTVTEYLPEDDRPGILTLALIKRLDLDAQVNDRFGRLSFVSQNIDLAHVNLPSLIAMSAETANLARNGDEELLGKAPRIGTSNSIEQPPMIMARMIGDEMEPTIKIKLFNLRVEYTVPMVLAAMGLAHNQTTEEALADLAESVATLTDKGPRSRPVPGQVKPPSSAGRQSPVSRPLKLDVVLRDCLIGLNPLDLPSKAFVVLTETHFNGGVPKREHFRATLEISKASLLIVDDQENLKTSGDAQTPTTPKSVHGNSQVSGLCEMGFVSVSYMSSAKASVQVVDTSDGGDRCVDLELKDDLLVLESCADSTQTLLSLLNGLKPPLPRKQDVKYRTEIIPVHDMLASLSGDAFGPSGQSEVADDFGPVLDESDVIEEEDTAGNLQFSQYSSSFYDPEIDSEPDPLSESLIGDDFGMLANPTMIPDTGEDAMLESFHEGFEMSSSGPLNFLEDHFASKSVVEGTAHKWDSKRNAYGTGNEFKVLGSPMKVRVRDVHLIWNLFDGYDWQRTRDTITKAVHEVEEKATERRARSDRRVSFEADDEEESVIGDFLFNSIYIGIPANRDPRDLSNLINRHVDDLASETESQAPSTMTQSPSRQPRPARAKGKRLRLNRSKHHKLAFELRGVCVDFVVFPPGSGETQSSVDVRVRDFEIFDLVPTSTWRKFATYMHDAGDRESGTSMLHLEILNVKPVADLAASEIVVKATILPLRLHVDQDALDFMMRFFEFKDESVPIHASKSDVPFLQRVEVKSVRVKMDYKPKTVDYAGLRSGHTTEFMNFFILDQADMILRHVIIYGVSGFDKLSKTLNDIWMPDIKKTQLPGVLAGLAPVRSLVNVGGGVRDLVIVPMREYRKDGRVVRSIQKGALSFAKTTTSELVKLGAKLAIGTQTVLQGAETFLNSPGQGGEGGWEDAELDEEEKKSISLYADQPVGVVQGLRGAYASLERDLLTTRDAIVAMPGEVLESENAQGAAKAVLRRAPTVIFRPAIGASKAISQTLMGATNSLDPQHRRRIDDKYKKH